MHSFKTRHNLLKWFFSRLIDFNRLCGKTSLGILYGEKKRTHMEFHIFESRFFSAPREWVRYINANTNRVLIYKTNRYRQWVKRRVSERERRQKGHNFFWRILQTMACDCTRHEFRTPVALFLSLSRSLHNSMCTHAKHTCNNVQARVYEVFSA